MSLDGKTLKVCSCNRTVALDAKALGAALGAGEPLSVHHQLCRRDSAAFQAAAGSGDDLIVACTQEAALFRELAPQSPVRFVNVREQAGWSAEGAKATPKIAALIAMAAAPDPEPAPAVELKSSGQLLIVGPAAAALDWAERLCGALDVSVLATGPGELPLERNYPVWS
ncbi:MAG TPA: 4Fe-4S ferredoxin, partial [Burkholderiales bacterium]|nr:4Fe-4S ferredoxin [Burkholderiales bacterium]